MCVAVTKEGYAGNSNAGNRRNPSSKSNIRLHNKRGQVAAFSCYHAGSSGGVGYVRSTRLKVRAGRVYRC